MATDPSLARRGLLGLLATAPLAPALPAAAQPAPRGTAPLATPPAVSSLRLGRVTVHAISDGAFAGPLAWWTGAPPAEIAARIRSFSGGDGQALRVNVTVWLVDDGERLTLIDTGMPAGAFPGLGRVPAGLAALGATPERIGLVAVTHAHFDHIGGLLKDGRAAYPNAELLVPRADVAHFTDPARRSAVPENARASYDLTAAAVAAYPRLQRIDGDGRAITPFISTVDLAGHTPGHTGYRISDGGQSLLIVADALMAPALHPAREEIGIAFEEDPAAARAMRARLFPRAAEDQALIAATHMPFPGIGRIVRDGGTLRWAVDTFPQDS